MSDCGPQRGARVVAAGALAVFRVDPPTTIYKRAAGALAVFRVDLPATIYKRAAGASAPPPPLRTRSGITDRHLDPTLKSTGWR
ncbi:hypothetical protein DOS48_12995 [Halorubrum sp. PV6]|nr:hypothetical protein DOS48_12995 [Halorubrum sp. PV6]